MRIQIRIPDSTARFPKDIFVAHLRKTLGDFGKHFTSDDNLTRLVILENKMQKLASFARREQFYLEHRSPWLRKKLAELHAQFVEALGKFDKDFEGWYDLESSAYLDARYRRTEEHK